MGASDGSVPPAYRLGRLLQRGRGAAIYAATRGRDGQAIALKVLDHPLRRAEALDWEYEIGRQLCGLPVVEVLARTSFDGRPALELAPFSGPPLQELLGTPLTIELFLRLATRLAEALEGVHGRGVVHQNLEPNSIIYDGTSGEVCLTGFDLAARLPLVAVDAATTHVGSLPHLAPELTGRMDRKVDGRADLYSLGIIFYQLLVGRLPFDAVDASGWIHSHLARRPPRVDRLRPTVPPVLGEIVDKLLAKVPEGRYQSAAGLVHDLRRCLQSWQTTLQLLPFTLAERDLSDRFVIPPRLYGREAERAEILYAFDRVQQSGAPELMMILGPSGIGKSSLVLEGRRELLARGALFAAGKCEASPTPPFAPLRQALGELVLQLLAGSEPEVAGWRARIGEALGANAPLLADLVPQLALLIGPAAAPAPASTEDERRLVAAFTTLIGIFARPEHPLVLLLDDLQWADEASCSLLVELLVGESGSHLLVVGTARPGEHGGAAPWICAARRRGAKIRDQVLGPLSPSALGELIADTLHTSCEKTAELGRLVSDNTAGNPFFAIHYLTALHRQGLIHFDYDERRWRWQMRAIAQQGYTANVADLLLDKLRDLPSATRQALQWAAASGSRVDHSVLAVVLGGDPAPVLQAALAERLLCRVEGGYGFLHDRVREAAYALFTEAERPAIHLALGRALLSTTPKERLDERIFDLVAQLGRGAAAAVGAERVRFAELCLSAARKARRTLVFGPALDYLGTAESFLGPAAWESERALMFALVRERAECENLVGRLAEAEADGALLLRRAQTPIERAAGYRVLIDVHGKRNEIDEARARTLECLASLGVEIPGQPQREDVEQAYAAIWRQLGDHEIETLLELPLISDPAPQAAIDTLAHFLRLNYYCEPNLRSVLLYRAVALSMRHGHCAAATHIYAWFGERLGNNLGQPRKGRRFATLALELMRRERFLAYRSEVHVACAITAYLTSSTQEVMEHLQHAHETALEVHDGTGVGVAAVLRLLVRLDAGVPLGEVHREAQAAIRQCERLGAPRPRGILWELDRLVESLRGHTSRLGVLDDPEHGQAELELASAPASIVYWHHLLKLVACTFAGDSPAAVAAALRFERVRGETTNYLCSLFAPLAGAAADGVLGTNERLPREQLEAHEGRLSLLAASYPPRFASSHALVAAELLRLDGQLDPAMRRYEEAIRLARQHGNLMVASLALERGALFYRERGLERLAEECIGGAHEVYQRWGADGKVAQLERLYPRIVELRRSGPGGPLALSEKVDLLSLVKASQTISSLVLPDELARTLLRLVLEQGGGRRAQLVLSRQDQLEVVAEATADESIPEGDRGPLPLSLLRYVQRTHERVLLADATVDAGRFGRDPYFARGQARSVLCLPIRQRTDVGAILYLENDLIPGAFTSERLLAIEMLAAQASISLENAYLLNRERESRVEAEAAKGRAVLLAEVTAAMSSTLRLEEAFRALVQRCVRSLADWAVVDVVEGEQTTRLAHAHRDPRREPLLELIGQRLPPADFVHFMLAALQAGRPLVFPHITQEAFRRLGFADEVVELLEALGTQCVAVIPLRVRDAPIGALTLLSAQPERFSPAEIEMAAEIGRRAAIAIDNARLLQATQHAVQLRDEFLRIASHELRTPLTSLKLSVELARELAGADATPQVALLPALDRARRQANRLEQLTKELLDVTMIEQNRLELQPERIDLGKLVHQVVDSYAADLARAGCSMSIDCRSTVIGRWDVSRLEQLLVILLSNAIKFGAGKPIEVTVERRPPTARLMVRDHGIGIDPSCLSRVFERFERAVSSTHYGGLGLGLYIARSVAQAHGGEIKVDSRLGQGATFIVEFPLEEGEDQLTYDSATDSSLRTPQ